MGQAAAAAATATASPRLRLADALEQSVQVCAGLRLVDVVTGHVVASSSSAVGQPMLFMHGVATAAVVFRHVVGVQVDS